MILVAMNLYCSHGFNWRYYQSYCKHWYVLYRLQKLLSTSGRIWFLSCKIEHVTYLNVKPSPLRVTVLKVRKDASMQAASLFKKSMKGKYICTSLSSYKLRSEVSITSTAKLLLKIDIKVNNWFFSRKFL